MHLFYSRHIAFPVHPLDEEESCHIVKVLRLKEGDTVFLTDGEGNMHRCSIVEAVARRCQVRILDTETTPPDPFRIHIAIAPTKNINRFEWFLEKATEIGVDVITPLICAHSERLNVKTDRLVRVLIAAMKQSWRSRLPGLQDPARFNDLVHRDFPGQKFIAYCETGKTKLLHKVYKPGSSVLILIGPEGDFSPEEVSGAIQAGFIPVSLGISRLRTETAGIVACCMIMVRNS